MWPFKPNDWKPVFVAEPDEYTVTPTIEGVPLTYREHIRTVTHTLYYSESRNKFYISWSGFCPDDREASPSYIACVKKQIELEKNNQK